MLGKKLLLIEKLVWERSTLRPEQFGLTIGKESIQREYVWEQRAQKFEVGFEVYFARYDSWANTVKLIV